MGEGGGSLFSLLTNGKTHGYYRTLCQERFGIEISSEGLIFVGPFQLLYSSNTETVLALKIRDVWGGKGWGKKREYYVLNTAKMHFMLSK